jgi:putative NADPH-quinone reductase
LIAVFSAGVSKNYQRSLSNKEGVIIMTSAASLDELKKSGTLRSLKTVYHEGIMAFCGIDLVRHLYLCGIDPTMSRTASERHLELARRLVADLVALSRYQVGR